MLEPQKRYKDRLFTTGPTGWAGTPHLKNWDTDFGAVIAAAQSAKGFTEDQPKTSINAG